MPQLLNQYHAALANASPMLYVILFLAGLGVNLTPCVYPLIPVTLSILSQAAKASKKHYRSFVFCYSISLAFAYALLGAVAARLGMVFGAQMAWPGMPYVYACVCALLGLAMWGILPLFDGLGRLMGRLSPSIDANQDVRVSTYFLICLLGVFAAFIAAPCTGPVLGAVLIVMSSQTEFWAGCIYMVVFAAGLALPYLAVGLLWQNGLRKLPKLGMGAWVVKGLFASVLFALGWFFLRIEGQTSVLPFAGNSFWQICGYGLVIFLISVWLLSFAKPHKQKNLLVVLILLNTVWIHAAMITAMEGTPESLTHNQPAGTGVWYSDFAIAMQEAQRTGKPLLVDCWAAWCGVCAKMDKEVWKDPSSIAWFRSHFVLLRLDVDHAPEPYATWLSSEEDSLKPHTSWNIEGLPTILIFKPQPIPTNGSAPEPQDRVMGYDNREEFMQKLEFSF